MTHSPVPYRGDDKLLFGMTFIVVVGDLADRLGG
jgi:hypothetical protein